MIHSVMQCHYELISWNFVTTDSAEHIVDSMHGMRCHTSGMHAKLQTLCNGKFVSAIQLRRMPYMAVQ